MGHRLPPDQMKLYRRIDEILFYVWDPIGISRSDWPRDEYQSYLPLVFQLVMQDAPTHEVRDYLIAIESEHMGLGMRENIEKRTEDIVTTLFEVKESLLDDTDETK